MHHQMLPAIVKLACFVLAILPLLIENLRTGQASNRNNLILLLAGLAMLAIDRVMGWRDPSLLASVSWIIAGFAILFTTPFLIPDFPSGVAKTCMALLPWFNVDNYLLLIVFGCLGTVLIGYFIRRRTTVVPVVPSFTLVGVVILAA